MKRFIFTFLCVSLFLVCRSQANGTGFQVLKYFKSSLETTVKEFVFDIPDTTITYRKYYILISEQYNFARASYEGYKGSMINCVNQGKNVKSIRKCLSTASPKLQENLDSLFGLLKRAYFDVYLENGITMSNDQTVQNNVSAIRLDSISVIINSLINAGIKIFNEASGFKKQLREQYVNDISSKEYILSDFIDLIKGARK